MRTVPETATYAAAVHLLVSRDAAAAIDRASLNETDRIAYDVFKYQREDDQHYRKM